MLYSVYFPDSGCTCSTLEGPFCVLVKIKKIKDVTKKNVKIITGSSPTYYALSARSPPCSERISPPAERSDTLRTPIHSASSHISTVGEAPGLNLQTFPLSAWGHNATANPSGFQTGGHSLLYSSPQLPSPRVESRVIQAGRTAVIPSHLFSDPPSPLQLAPLLGQPCTRGVTCWSVSTVEVRADFITLHVQFTSSSLRYRINNSNSGG
jgi:hypothetical protein